MSIKSISGSSFGPPSAPTESKIASVANSLSAGKDIASTREDLLSEGYSEYGVYLCIRAAETHNRMIEKRYPAIHDESPSTERM